MRTERGSVIVQGFDAGRNTREHHAIVENVRGGVAFKRLARGTSLYGHGLEGRTAAIEALKALQVSEGSSSSVVFLTHGTPYINHRDRLVDHTEEGDGVGVISDNTKHTADDFRTEELDSQRTQ